MKNLYRFLVDLGIRDEQSAIEQRRIRTVNLLNAVVLLFLLAGITHYFFLESDYPIASQILFISLALLAGLLSYFGKTEFGFLVFTLNVNLSIYFVAIYYPFETACYLYYFPLIVSLILLNNVSARNWITFTHLGVSALFFILAISTDPWPSLKPELSTEQIRLVWTYNVIISVILTALVSALLNRLLIRQNQEILEKNKTLSLAQERINASLREKEVLLAELNHRVKNNLAIISGLLNLQHESTSNAEARHIINESRNRVMSMGLVHKMLYNNPQLKQIDMARYTAELVRELLNTFQLSSKVNLYESYQQINLTVEKSIPYGLILNEIVTNCIKYAFHANRSATHALHLQISQDGKDTVVVIRDSGKGFPENFRQDAEDGSLGLFLIKSLVEQIDGQVDFSNQEGARVEFRFSAN